MVFADHHDHLIGNHPRDYFINRNIYLLVKSFNMVLNAAILSASNFTRLMTFTSPERSAAGTGHWNLVNIQEWLECEPLPSPTVFGKKICHVWPTESFPLCKESPPLTGHISSRISAAACIHFPPVRLNSTHAHAQYVPISGCTFLATVLVN